MDIIYFLVSISLILSIYGHFKVLALFWFTIIAYPRRQVDKYKKCLTQFARIANKFPNHPNLKIIERYIKNSDKNINKCYVRNAIYELHFAKPEFVSLLEKFQRDIVSLADTSGN